MSGDQNSQSNQSTETPPGTEETQNTNQTSSLLSQTQSGETPEETIKTNEENSTPDKEATPTEPFTFKDLTLADGFEMSEELQTRFMETFSDETLSPRDRAQKLLDMHTELQQAEAQRMADGWTQKVSEWVDEIKSDPNIGGEKLEATLGGIKRFLGTYERHEALFSALDETHFGSNPEIIRFMHWVSTRLNEGKPAEASTQAKGEAGASLLFPTAKA